MKGRERLSGPAWICFRAEFRRRWRGRNIARALGLLVLVAGLQLVLGLAAQQLARRLGTMSGWYWLYSQLAAFGLYSPLAPVIANRSRWGPPGLQSWLLVQDLVTIPWLAYRFLLPAAAANSIAPDREQRRISELILAGLTPRQIVIAKGLAAVLPYLAVATVSLGASCAAYEWMRDASAKGFYSRLMLSESVLAAGGLFFSAAIQVCLSALSQRARIALTICYGFECLLIPIFYQVSQWGWTLALFSSYWTGLSDWGGLGRFLAPQLTVLLLEAVALSLLWPRALRTIAYPDEGAGSPPTALRTAR